MTHQIDIEITPSLQVKCIWQNMELQEVWIQNKPRSQDHWQEQRYTWRKLDKHQAQRLADVLTADYSETFPGLLNSDLDDDEQVPQQSTEPAIEPYDNAEGSR